MLKKETDAKKKTDAILFGAAYYDEYMPRDLNRIDTAK